MKLRAAAVSKCFPATTTANASTSSSASEVEPVQHTPNCTLPGTESNIANVKRKSCPNLTYLWWNPRDAFTLGSKLPFSSMPCLIYLFWSPIFILKQLPWNLVSSFQVVTDEKLLTFPDHLGPLDLDYPDLAAVHTCIFLKPNFSKCLLHLPSLQLKSGLKLIVNNSFH